MCLSAFGTVDPWIRGFNINMELLRRFNLKWTLNTSFIKANLQHEPFSHKLTQILSVAGVKKLVLRVKVFKTYLGPACASTERDIIRLVGCGPQTYISLCQLTSYRIRPKTKTKNPTKGVTFVLHLALTVRGFFNQGYTVHFHCLFSWLWLVRNCFFLVGPVVQQTADVTNSTLYIPTQIRLLQFWTDCRHISVSVAF